MKVRCIIPCNSITTQSVKLANAMPEIVLDALKDLGWNIQSETNSKITAYKSYESLTWESGKGITLSGMSNQTTAEKNINAITKQYSKRAVTWAAQRAGWQVTTKSENTLNITRR